MGFYLHVHSKLQRSTIWPSAHKTNKSSKKMCMREPERLGIYNFWSIKFEMMLSPRQTSHDLIIKKIIIQICRNSLSCCLALTFWINLLEWSWILKISRSLLTISVRQPPLKGPWVMGCNSIQLLLLNNTERIHGISEREWELKYDSLDADPFKILNANARE